MALWPSSALAQFTYSCMTLFTIVRESSKGLARLIREIYMCRGLMAISRRPPPPSSSSSVAVVCLRRRLPSLYIVHRRHLQPAAILLVIVTRCHPSHLPPARHRRSPSSSVTFLYCIHRAEDIVQHLPQPISPTIPLFLSRMLIPNSKETPSAMIKVILMSSSSVGHSARQAIEHEHALSHYYVSLFIHTFASTFALLTFAFYN